MSYLIHRYNFENFREKETFFTNCENLNYVLPLMLEKSPMHAGAPQRYKILLATSLGRFKRFLAYLKIWKPPTRRLDPVAQGTLTFLSYHIQHLKLDDISPSQLLSLEKLIFTSHLRLHARFRNTKNWKKVEKNEKQWNCLIKTIEEITQKTLKNLEEAKTSLDDAKVVLLNAKETAKANTETSEQQAKELTNRIVTEAEAEKKLLISVAKAANKKVVAIAQEKLDEADRDFHQTTNQINEWKKGNERYLELLGQDLNNAKQLNDGNLLRNQNEEIFADKRIKTTRYQATQRPFHITFSESNSELASWLEVLAKDRNPVNPKDAKFFYKEGEIAFHSFLLKGLDCFKYVSIRFPQATLELFHQIIYKQLKDTKVSALELLQFYLFAHEIQWKEGKQACLELFQKRCFGNGCELVSLLLKFYNSIPFNAKMEEELLQLLPSTHDHKINLLSQVPDVEVKALVRHLEQSAKEGSAPAGVVIAQFCRTGFGSIKKDAALGFRILESLKDYLPAQADLAYCLLVGIGAPEDDKRAVKVLQEIAKKTENQIQKVAFAQYLLGICLEYGKGDLPKNINAGIDLIKSVADQGLAVAQCHLGRHYIETDPELGLYYYKMADEQSYGMATFEFGRCYETGKGMRVDLNEAVRLHKKAAQHLDFLGTQHLSVIYNAGLIVPKNPRKAFSFLKKCLVLQNYGLQSQKLQTIANLYCTIAKYYFRGDGVDVDFDKGLECYQTMIQLKNKDVNVEIAIWCNFMAEQYEKGEGGVKVSLPNARILYHLAAELEHPGALKKIQELPLD